MATTIQVQGKTLRLLRQEKRRLGVSSYDEVIRFLAEKKQPSSQVMFGIDRGRIKPFSEENHLDLHEF